MSDTAEGRTLFILEGPEGSGKGVHARKIMKTAKKAGYSSIIFYAPAPVPGQSSILPMFLPAFALLEKYDCVIMIRSPMSEIVYGSVLRGSYIGAPWEWRLWLEMTDCKHEEGLQINKVFLDDDVEVLRKNASTGRGRKPGENFEKIVQEYRKLAMDSVDIGWAYTEDLKHH